MKKDIREELVKKTGTDTAHYIEELGLKDAVIEECMALLFISAENKGVFDQTLAKFQTTIEYIDGLGLEDEDAKKCLIRLFLSAASKGLLSQTFGKFQKVWEGNWSKRLTPRIRANMLKSSSLLEMIEEDVESVSVLKEEPALEHATA